jgi:hypothetical protein
MSLRLWSREPNQGNITVTVVTGRAENRRWVVMESSAMDFSPECQQEACAGQMRTRAPATDTLADEELWFQCELCGTEKHSTNLGDVDAH